MTVLARLSGGHTVEGSMTAWGSGWAVIDGVRWDGVVFVEVAR